MRPSTKRLMIIFGSLALFIGAVYAATSLAIPAFKNVQELRAERQSKGELLANKTSAEEKIQSLVNTYNTIINIQKDFSSMLPLEPDATNLLNSLQAIAKNNAIIMNSVSFEYPAIRQSGDILVKGVGAVRANLSLSGTYESLKGYINQIATNMRLIDVKSIKIDGGAVRDRSILSYTLVIDAHYQTE